MVEKWETVQSKSSKKALKKSNGVPKADKDAKRTSHQHHQDDSAVKAPDFEDRSQYEALTPKEKVKTGKDADHRKNGEAAKQKSMIPKPQKKDGSKKTGQKLKLESLVPMVTGEEMESTYLRCQETFKDNPLMWLKSLTGQLNSRLDQAPHSDPLFTDHPEDFPSSLLNTDVKKIFNKSMKECTLELLEVFLEQLIQSVMSETAKGNTVYGYQIAAQLLAKQRHDLFTIKLDKYLELLGNNKNVPAKCLTIMWIMGQGGRFDFRTGLKVWTSLMLPVIGIKNLGQYSLAYLGKILKKADSKLDQGYNVIDMKNFFLLFDGAFSNEGNIHPSLQKQLKGFYPTLKKLSLGKTPEKTVHKYFASFLARLREDGPQTELQQETLGHLVFCLSTSKECFAVWQRVYSQHLAQTSVALNYLADNGRLKGINYKLLRETVKAFSTANAQLNHSLPGFRSCVLACARFEEMHSSYADSGMSTIKLIFLLCVATAAGFVSLDYYQTGGYKGSSTEKLLTKTGADVLAAKAFSQLTSYVSIVAGFLSRNVPKWTETVMVYVEPLLDVVWNYSLIVVRYIINTSVPIRKWIAENIPSFIDRIIMHPGWETLYNYLVEFRTLIQPYVDVVVRAITSSLDKVMGVFSS